MNDHTHRFWNMGDGLMCACGETMSDPRTDEQRALDRSIGTLRHQITVNTLMNASHVNLDAQLADLVAQRAALG